MTNTTIERSRIRTMLEEDYSDGNWESLIDKIEDMLTDNFSAGYSFAKKEEELVAEAAKSLSD